MKRLRATLTFPRGWYIPTPIPPRNRPAGRQGRRKRGRAEMARCSSPPFCRAFPAQCAAMVTSIRPFCCRRGGRDKRCRPPLFYFGVPPRRQPGGRGNCCFPFPFAGGMEPAIPRQCVSVLIRHEVDHTLGVDLGARAAARAPAWEPWLRRSANEYCYVRPGCATYKFYRELWPLRILVSWTCTGCKSADN